ncbi:sugar phosphate isomerase/epimerase family protein [Viridibacillus arvi]|uniref:sugar phosphate isomerase/epimerase family protein n=1 Tax=Viridibacillus arvi TaxID=263475 RepID=UPI003CFFC2CC
MDIYVSTSALKNPFNLEEVLKKYYNLGIRNIELGSSHDYVENVKEILEKYDDVNFVIHNYFPPKKETLALNIASTDLEIRQQSIAHAKEAIDLCVQLKAPIYSIHAGMLVDPQKIEFFKGFTFTEGLYSEELYEEVFKNLIDSCNQINEYAKERSIKFAVETSGGHPSKFDYLLMTKINEFKRLFEVIDDDNFGVLLDIGHYNLSTYLYEKQDLIEFIQLFKRKIFQIHIHHNDGSDDQHLPPTARELELLKLVGNNTLIVLESMKNSEDGILMSLEELKSFPGGE